MQNQNTLLYNVNNSIATIIINKPEVKNAFDDKLIIEFTNALDKAEKDENVKAVVLCGADNNFSSGADLNWMKSMINFSLEENFNDAMQLANLLEKLNNFAKPTIALIEGNVFGGAIGLVAACDIAISDTNTKFCLSEVKLGLSPAVISPYVIAAIGERFARRYMLTAELFDAKIAKEIGLIHITTEKENLDKDLSAILTKIIYNGPKAIKATKKLILDITKHRISEDKIKDHTANLISELRVSAEGQEGLNAFFAKQKPNWI